jgi:hypothetical protein
MHFVAGAFSVAEASSPSGSSEQLRRGGMTAPPRRPHLFPVPSSDTEATLCQGCEIPENPSPGRTVVEARGDALDILRSACTPLTSAVPRPDSTQRLTSLSFGPRHGDGANQVKTKMANMMNDLQNLLVGLHSETRGCPEGCKRVNNPEVILDTRPDANTASSRCPYRSYESLRGISAQAVRSADPTAQYRGNSLVRTFTGSEPSQCMQAATRWTESIAREQSPLGTYMATNCPSPCSYSSQTRFVFKSVSRGCELEVAFDLRCGPPRDSGFFESNASWTALPAVRHRWTCQPM